MMDGGRPHEPRLTVYHTSDLHDRRGAVGALDTLRISEPNLLFDCGDSLRGSQTVFHRSEPIVAELDAAGYHAQAMGNREFHYLYGCVQARARRMRHPLVCANLVDVRNRPLPFVPELPFVRYDGTHRWDVLAFGLLVPQYPEGSPWETVFGWRFLDPFAVAERIAARVAPDTVLIALSHLGLRADRELAARVPRLDLVLGGHSHDTLHVPEFAGSVPIVHAGPYGEFVSRTTLQRGADGRAAIAHFALLPLREPAAAGA